MAERIQVASVNAPDGAELHERDESVAMSLYDALLPLCDDLPGEPPALVAWSPMALARALAEALENEGYTITLATPTTGGQ